MLENRKRLVLLAVCLIALTAIVFLILPGITFAASAAGRGMDWEQRTQDFMDIASADRAEAMLGLNQEFSQAMNMITQTIQIALEGVTIAFVTAMTIYAVVKELAQGSGRLDMWVKALIKLILGIAVVMYTGTIMDWIETFGRFLVEEIAQAVNLAAGTTQSLAESGLYSMEQSMNYIDIATAGILSLFLTMYIKIVSYSLLIELCIRKAFACIAVASIVTQGLRSPGVRFLKKTLAVYIKMIIIIIVYKLGLVIVAAGSGTARAIITGIAPLGNNLIEALIIMGACTTFIGKGCTLADEILGTA